MNSEPVSIIRKHAQSVIDYTLKTFLLLAVFVLSASYTRTNAQETQKITGKVVGSDTNEGLPGVTVFAKGTSNGTITDIDGYYSISVGSDDILVFSYVGYLSQESPVNDRTSINVELELDVQNLDEVVIVGYGEQKMANLTGAITVVEPEELENIPTGNLSQTLIGKLAGVQVNRNGTGIPGTPSPLVIRAESASGAVQRQVLYVIDGVVYTNEQDGTGPSGDEMFNRLDPSEIESISILKDAAAAVYGARGAGGVVLVKTKKGQPGKVRVNYNGSMGIGRPTRIPDMLTARQHAEMLNAILNVKKQIPGERVRDSDYFTDEELDIIKDRNYNWLEGLNKDAVSSRHSLNVSGGGEKVRYFLSGNYYSETGNFENIWYKRYGLRSNIEADLSKDLVFSMGLSFYESQRKNPDFKQYSDPGSGVLREFYKRPLTASKWIPSTLDGLPTSINSSWNPYGFIDSNNYKLSTGNNTNVTGKLEYKAPFLNGLRFGAMVSYNVDVSENNSFRQNYYTYRLINLPGGRVPDIAIDYDQDPDLQVNSEGIGEGFGKGINYQVNLSTDYSKLIGNHNISATLVYEQTDGSSKDIGITKSVADLKGFEYLWAFSNETNVITSNYRLLGRWGVIGRLTYDFKGKYLIESSFRGEASSKFAKDERFGFFPSVSAGWVISEESFFNVSAINFLKIRTSYGLVGNDNTRPYEHKAAYQANTTVGPLFGTGTGSLSNAIVARNNGVTVPSRTWAKVRTLNVGLDVSAFERKVKFSSEYYYALTYDGFMSNSTIPYEFGNSKPPYENYKESYSTGLEFQLGYNNSIGNDFKYSIDANFTKRRSRPLKLYQNLAVLGTWVDELANDDSNQPGYVALGIIRTQEDLDKVKAMYPTINGQEPQLGMIYYKDIGGPNYSREPDGVLDGNDRTIIAKYTTPPYSYGLSLGLSWKMFSLSGTFVGVFGHKVFVQKDEQDLPTSTSNVFAWWGDYWTSDNPDAAYPRPYKYGLDGEMSTFWMRNGHTLRLNNMNFSVTVPEKLSRKIKISNWKAYVTVTNVWTIISPFDWKDPAVSMAYDYPLVRMVNVGMRFSL